MRIYPQLLVDQEFKTLGDQGFSGTLNDRQFAFLRSKGYVNALPDMMTSWLSYSPANLFSLNEPGIWLDPSDLTTMYQDRAGSTAVTTPGQSVGLRLDKSKGLVLGSELVTNGDFSDGTTGWTNASTGTGTFTVASGAASLTGTDASNRGAVRQTVTCVVGRYYEIVSLVSGAQLNVALGSGTLLDGTGGASVTGSGSVRLIVNATATTMYFKAWSIAAGGTATIDNISVKELPGNHAVANSDAARGIYGIEPLGGRRNLLLNTTTMATQNVTVTAVAHTLSFTGTGTVTLSGVSTAGPLVGTGANNRVSLTFTPTAGTLTLTVSGSVTLAQLQIGSAFDAYQRVGTTQYDVTEAGKQTLHYVQYDGSDDGYVTPTITPGIDKVQVFAGVRKLSDAAVGMLVELSVSRSTNNGSFSLSAPPSPAAQYGFGSKGAADAFVSASGFAAPITNVVTGIGDIANDLSRIRVNGTQIAENLTDQNAGNYLAYPLYIGRRGGTTLPFNGRDYGIITRFGANLDASTIAATESWLNQKTGAY